MLTNLPSIALRSAVRVTCQTNCVWRRSQSHRIAKQCIATSSPPKEGTSSNLEIDLKNGNSLSIKEVKPWYAFGSVGAVVWPVALRLLDVIKVADVPQDLGEENNFTAIELGSGTGVVGIAICAMTGAKVILTDKPPASSSANSPLQLCSHNIMLNSDLLGDIEVQPLLWGDDVAIDKCLAFTKAGGGFDLVVGSDITYHTPGHPLLFYTAAKLLRKAPSVSHTPLKGLLISHHYRGETSYQSMLRAAGEAGFATPRSICKENTGVGTKFEVLQFLLRDDSDEVVSRKQQLPPTPSPVGHGTGG